MLYNYNPTDKENRPTMIWIGVLFVAIVWTALEAPISFVLDYKVEESNMWWDGIFCSIFLFDIYLRLSKKLKLPSAQKHQLDIVNNVKEVPYYKSLWLPIDIFTSLPFDIIAFSLGLSLPAKVLSTLRLMRVIRIVKLRSLLGLVDFLPKSIKVAVAVTGVVVAIHWIACGWMLITPRPELDPWSFYNVSLYWTVTTLTTVGYGDITPGTNLGRIYTMGVMIIGVGTYGIIIGNFSRMIMLADKYKEERKEKLSNLHLFLRHYNIPLSLQRQVYSYYDHMINKNISELDGQIMSELPKPLQGEMQVYMKIKLIRNVHIFKDCTTPCLKMIAQCLEQEFFSPYDYICKKGDQGNEMYIIGHGEVEVVSGEKVVAELKAGQFFGEIALIEDTIRSADIISQSYCDLYKFKKDDFKEVIVKYPDLGEKFQKIYKKRKSDNQEPEAA
jgi:hypothetical protein